MDAMRFSLFPKPVLSQREKWAVSVAVFLLFVVLFFDQDVLKFVGLIRVFPLDSLMLFMTDFGLLYAVIMAILYLVSKKKYRDLALIALTSGLALEISYLMKVLIQTPRPFAAAVVATIPLTQASGYAMPSLHTAVCFAFWPYLQRAFPDKRYRQLGAAIILAIAASRLYLGVHYLSDLIAGGLIGYLLAKICIYFEDEHQFLEWFIFHVKDKFELRRQVLHLLLGSAVVFLLRLQLLNTGILLVIVVVGGMLSLIMRSYKIPLLYNILLFFERPDDMRTFPGKGSFFLMLGSLLAMVLFRREVALAAIAIMAVGDSITTIIGTYFGKIKNPLNPRKHLEGTALAIVASTLAAFFFVDFQTAFWGSVMGMLFESITVRYISQIIDDNVIIPIVAGVTMSLLMGA